MLLGVGWLVALATAEIAYTLSLWAAFVFAATLTVFVLYAWATK